MLIAALLTICLILFIFLSDTLDHGISPMPTSKKVRQTLLAELDPNFKGCILDLGSGFGTLALHLERYFQHAEIRGIEGAKIPFFISKVLTVVRGSSRLKVVKQNFLDQNLGSYDLIVCYLYRGVMDDLAKKLKKETRPGTLIVSHTFAIRGLPLYKQVCSDDLYRTPIYYYKIP